MHVHVHVRERENSISHRHSRILNSRLHAVVDTWCELVETRQRLRKRMLVSMQRWSVAKLRTGMRAWSTFVTLSQRADVEADRQTQTARRIFGRIVHRALALRFESWTDFVSERRRLRKFMLRVKNAHLAAWFDTWANTLDLIKRQRALVVRSMSRIMAGRFSVGPHRRVPPSRPCWRRIGWPS